MKKKTVALAVVIFTFFTAFPLSLNTHAGILSGIGISKAFDSLVLGFDIESSFPGYAIANGYICEEYDDCSFGEGFKNGSLYFIGADLYAHYTLLSGDFFSIRAGFDMFAGTETIVKNLDVVLKGSLVFSIKCGKSAELTANLNYPLIGLIDVSGFRSPLIFVPKSDILTIMTGWKLGCSVPI